jgi:WD40 repeat protein
MQSRPNPYVGPRYFKRNEKIYGRTLEINRLNALLTAERIVLLYSPSGAGKTSLINAGLIPLLLEDGFEVLETMRVNLPTQPYHPKNRYIFSALLSLEKELPEDKQIPLRELEKMTLPEYLAARPREIPEGKRYPPPELLIFDQFEEIITTDPTDLDGKQSFFEQVAEALYDRRRWTLFSMREDFIASLDPYVRLLPSRLENRFRLDLLETNQAKKAIQIPSENAGVRFTDEAASKLLNDLRQVTIIGPLAETSQTLGAYVEPVQLQVVCYELWKRLPEDAQQITPAEIQSMGDVDQSLGAFYAGKVQETAGGNKQKERMIRDWFENQLITENNIRNQVLLDKNLVDRLGVPVLEALENAHLIRRDSRRNRVWFELSHDRLVKPVRESNKAWFEKYLRLLQRQSVLWHRQNQLDNLLLTGEDLENEEAWARANPQALTPDEDEYLKACVRQREKVEELQREKERRYRQMRVLLLLVGIVAVLAIFFGVRALNFAREADAQRSIALTQESIAITQQNEAERQKQIAENNAAIAVANQETAVAAQSTAEASNKRSEELLVEAQNEKERAEQEKIRADKEKEQAELALRRAEQAVSETFAAEARLSLTDNPLLAISKSLKAYRSYDTYAARDILLEALQLTLKQTLVPYGEPIINDDFGVYSVAMSTDGHHLAWGMTNGRIIIRDYQVGTEVERIQADGRVVSLEFSPDGEKLAAITNKGHLYLFRVVDGNELGSWSPERDRQSFGLSFSPDGEQLAAGSGSDILIFELPNFRVLKALYGHIFTIEAVAWSPTQNRIASASSDGTARVWNLDQGEDIRTFRLVDERPFKEVFTVAWTPDGERLAIAGNTPTALLFDVERNRKIGEFTGGHALFINDLDISADGRLLATGGGEPWVVVWDTELQKEIARLQDQHWSSVTAVDFSPLGGAPLLLSGSRDSRVRLTQVITTQPIAEPVGQPLIGPVGALGIADDNTLHAAAFVESYGSSPVYLYKKTSSDQNFTQMQSLREPISALAYGSSAQQLVYSPIDLDQPANALIMDPETTERVEPINFNSPTTGNMRLTSLVLQTDLQWVGASICASESVEANNNQVSCPISESYLLLRSPDGTQSSDLHIPAHSNLITALAYNPVGNQIATGGLDKTIILWRYDNGHLVMEGRPMQLRNAAVASLAFSPGGETLAVGFADGTLVLVDTQSQEIIGEALIGAAAIPVSLVFNADGTVLYSGDELGNVLAWDVNPYNWAVRLCNYFRTLAPEDEWEDYFPVSDRRLSCSDWFD